MGQISMGHARTLLNLEPTSAEQAQVCQDIIAKRLSVRETEAISEAADRRTAGTEAKSGARRGKSRPKYPGGAGRHGHGTGYQRCIWALANW